MKIKYFFIILIFIVSLFAMSNIVSAKQSDEFINFLSNKVYKDCKGENITVKDVDITDFKCSESHICLIDLRSELTLFQVQEKITKWPNYNAKIIKEFLEIFSSVEPYKKFTLVGDKKMFNQTFLPNETLNWTNYKGEKYVFYKEGDNLLKCNNHVLDINGTDYYWDNEKVVLPRNNFVLFGINLVSIGGITVFGFSLLEIFSFTILTIIIVRIKRICFILNKIKTKIFIKKK
ncbi:MAG: hypothetical protein KAI71_01945 [Candidatus Pacebacteria bacterium]|nr:hypothetical protein [Candidatus Paceibacterota bacterium]